MTLINNEWKYRSEEASRGVHSGLALRGKNANQIFLGNCLCLTSGPWSKLPRLPCSHHLLTGVFLKSQYLGSLTFSSWCGTLFYWTFLVHVHQPARTLWLQLFLGYWARPLTGFWVVSLAKLGNSITSSTDFGYSFLPCWKVYLSYKYTSIIPARSELIKLAVC
jgi:hypothetical protein